MRKLIVATLALLRIASWFITASTRHLTVSPVGGPTLTTPEIDAAGPGRKYSTSGGHSW